MRKNTFLRTNRVLDSWSKIGLAMMVAIAVTPPMQAQTPAANGFDFGAKKVTARTNGVRLDGNAFIKSPQLDARAGTVAFDFAGRNITSVRAQGAVNLKVNLLPKGGGTPALIQSKSNSATLDPINRTLVLLGNVDGFYQLRGGAKNTLRGTKATISYPTNGQFTAVVEGGTGGVRLVIPAATVTGGAAGIGSVTVTARNLSINSADGTATFTGNARAISNDGATKFDVSAPAFILNRNASDGLESLRSSGRTLVKVDLPNTAASPTVTATTPDATSVGRPTYFEVASDSLTLLGASNGANLGTLTFNGNVSGFYRLVGANGVVDNLPFKGDLAVIRNSGTATDNFQLEVTGAPVEISAPGFDLGF